MDDEWLSFITKVFFFWGEKYDVEKVDIKEDFVASRDQEKKTRVQVNCFGLCFIFLAQQHRSIT